MLCTVCLSAMKHFNPKSVFKYFCSIIYQLIKRYSSWNVMCLQYIHETDSHANCWFYSYSVFSLNSLVITTDLASHSGPPHRSVSIWTESAPFSSCTFPAAFPSTYAQNFRDDRIGYSWKIYATFTRQGFSISQGEIITHLKSVIKLPSTIGGPRFYPQFLGLDKHFRHENTSFRQWKNWQTQKQCLFQKKYQ